MLYRLYCKLLLLLMVQYRRRWSDKHKELWRLKTPSGLYPSLTSATQSQVPYFTQGSNIYLASSWPRCTHRKKRLGGGPGKLSRVLSGTLAGQGPVTSPHMEPNHAESMSKLTRSSANSRRNSFSPVIINVHAKRHVTGVYILNKRKKHYFMIIMYTDNKISSNARQDGVVLGCPYCLCRPACCHLPLPTLLRVILHLHHPMHHPSFAAKQNGLPHTQGRVLESWKCNEQATRLDAAQDRVYNLLRWSKYGQCLLTLVNMTLKKMITYGCSRGWVSLPRPHWVVNMVGV